MPASGYGDKRRVA